MIINGTKKTDFLVGTSLDDTIDGKSGDDTVVGDRFNNGIGFPDIILECNAGEGADFVPTPGADGLSHSSHNDTLIGGKGDDIVVGEAYVLAFGDLQLNALAGTGGFMGGPGGDNNSVDCYNDFFDPGKGNDIVVGDVYYTVGPADPELTAAAGSAGQGHFSFFPHGPGGDGGDGNVSNAFNDVMGDDTSNDGHDILVGDVFAQNTNGSDDHLNALAGAAGLDGGDGGDDNEVHAFNDLLNGGNGGDLIVGDDWRSSGTGDIVLDAFAGTGGDGVTGGIGGSNNTVEAFSDTLFGADGSDFIVGDAYQTSHPTSEIEFHVLAGAPGFDGSAGGTGNVVTAFNDELFGNNGSDFLIGDASHTSATDGVEVTVSGTPGNVINAFQDVLDGGRGDDLLVGDFAYSTPPGSDPAVLSIIGSFTGQDRLFADTLDGGDGADLLIGGLGADTMTGGAGADLFTYLGGDLFDLVGGVPKGAPPVDLITDFKGKGTDVIDLRDLLDSLGFDASAGDDINDWLTYTFVLGGDGTISIDQDGSASNYLPMLTLAGFTTGVDIDTMVGVELIV